MSNNLKIKVCSIFFLSYFMLDHNAKASSQCETPSWQTLDDAIGKGDVATVETILRANPNLAKGEVLVPGAGVPEYGPYRTVIGHAYAKLSINQNKRESLFKILDALYVAGASIASGEPMGPWNYPGQKDVEIMEEPSNVRAPYTLRSMAHDDKEMLNWIQEKQAHKAQFCPKKK